MDRLPFRVSSDPKARDALLAFGPGNATLGISLSLVEAGTNRWIFDDEHVAAWLRGEPDASWIAPGQDSTVQIIKKLWLYGPPGSGRTLVAASLIDKLVRRQQSEPHHAVCYYFASDVPIEREAILCLRTLIAQLAQQSEDAYEDFNRSVKFGALPSAHNSAEFSIHTFDAEDLVHLVCLLDAMSLHFTQVSVVIRSIDYMEMALASQLTALTDKQCSTIRTIFTSDDGSGQRDACVETVSCPVEVAAAEDDVRIHVRNEMKRRMDHGDSSLEPEAPRREIEDYIVNNSNGSWLWAITTLDDQCDLLRRNLWASLASSFNSTDQRPDISKPTFDSYLERIFRDEDPMPKFILTRTAHWLAIARNEPTFCLTAEEHLKALTALFGTVNEEFRRSERMIRTEDIVHACRPIVRLANVEDGSHFQFRHETVHGYLVHALPHNLLLRDVSYDGYTMGREFKDFVAICDALTSVDAGCASSLFKKLLHTQEKLFGHDDADTLFTQEHFASFCWDEGRLDEAERLYLDIIRGYEKNPPHFKDPHYNVLNNLGIFYKRQGRYEEAERYYQAALRGREAYHGPAHESTLNTVSNIAQMYAAQGKTGAAQAQWAKVLPLCESTFGQHDTKTLAVVYNLGLTHKILGEFQQAETLLTRALAEHDQIYGTEHSSTLDVVSSLAHVHSMCDDDLTAESLYKRALTSYEKLQGPMGRDVLSTCHSLAKVYQALNQMQKAETMCKRALDGLEATVGPDDINSIDVAYTLFLGYIDEERLREGVELGGRVLAGFEKEHGGRVGITASVADNMALAHAKLGEYAQAESLWQRAYDGHVKVYGTHHERPLAVANNLGLLFMRQLRVEDAERWLRLALQGYEEIVGPRSDTTARIAWDLAVVYQELGRHGESDDLLARFPGR